MTTIRRLADMTDAVLDARYPSSGSEPERLFSAIRYSLFPGGKRLRPAVCLQAAVVCGGSVEKALPAACAVELVHSYSLVHDDLPAMDNDDLRRGKPSLHKAFDEATAILAGDALLTDAFGLIAEQTDASVALPMVRRLVDCAGARGMVAGQLLDMIGEGQTIINAAGVERMYAQKTAAMFEASAVLGALSANAGEPVIRAFERYGRYLGMAFQATDDLLDATGSTETIGKTAGKDAAAKKATLVAAIGIDATRAKAKDWSERAAHALSGLEGNAADFLRTLARFASERTS
jgi:geranylgeranyl pyrophosphate synthase